MKKTFSLLILILILSVCGCRNNSTGIIGGADGPTKIYVKSSKNQGIISNVRLINVDGTLYYDTGLQSRQKARCGTLDGSLEKTVSEFAVPEKNGEANFESKDSNYFGYQNATSISKELPLDEGWIVFKKIAEERLTGYKYVFCLKGTHPKAVKESKYIVFANTMDISFETITRYFFSSKLEDHLIDIKVIIPEISDEWGILMYAGNTSDTGVTVYIEQFGGNFKGELITGAPYTLEVLKNENWQEAPTKTGMPLVWNSMAYSINCNEINEYNIDFSFSYNKLEKGTYRIGKKIMDFVESGNFSEKTYYAEFKIE